MSSTELVKLRAEVRQFIDEQRAISTFTPVVDCWVSAWNEPFTRALAERGWLGMTIPVKYGGHGRTYLERYVVTEELLSAGAPVAAHWVADRQIGPSLLRYGTEEQRAEFLPRIARGEAFFAIGMSEPESGSDLASVKSKAVRVDGGWLLNGTKTWTGGAHRAHTFIALVRTSDLDEGASKHDGLSQFIIPLEAPGVSKEPIHWIDGTHHFNRVTFTDVLVPDRDVVGEIGQGWPQVTSELKFERSGPERFLSTMPALEALLAVGDPDGRVPDRRLGRHIARLTGLHSLSFEVARRLQLGDSPELQASMVKVLGTVTEGELADDIADWASGAARLDERLSAASDKALLRRAGFTLRGGTNEILRGIIAKGLGKPQPLESELDEELNSQFDAAFAPDREARTMPAPLGAFSRQVWAQARRLGTGRSVNGRQGVGENWSATFSLLHSAAASGFALPLVEHNVLAAWLADRTGVSLGEGAATVGWVVNGITQVPWGRHAETTLVVDEQRNTVTAHTRGDLELEERNDIAGVARDRVTAVLAGGSAVRVAPEIIAELRLRGALARSIQIVGTLMRSVEIAHAHAATRQQFGRPLAAFQAVQALLADAAAEQAVARSAVLRAVRIVSDDAATAGDVRSAIAIAKSCASEAVGVVVRNTHQVIGAIGTTQDHELHHYTLPALAWREDFGTVSDWNAEIGAAVCESGLSDAWRAITSAGHLGARVLAERVGA